MRNAARLMGVLAVVLAASSAWANPPLAAQADATVRLDLPFSNLTVAHGSGWWSMGGASLSFHFLRLAEVEAGAQAITNPCVNGFMVTARAGISPTVMGRQADGTGWRFRIPVLASLQYVRASGDGCDGHSEDHTDLVTAVTGLDATYFRSGSSGITFRLLGFAGPAVAAGTSRVVGASLDVGWNFGVL